MEGMFRMAIGIFCPNCNLIMVNYDNYIGCCGKFYKYPEIKLEEISQDEVTDDIIRLAKLK